MGFADPPAGHNLDGVEAVQAPPGSDGATMSIGGDWRLIALVEPEALDLELT